MPDIDEVERPQSINQMLEMTIARYVASAKQTGEHSSAEAARTEAIEVFHNMSINRLVVFYLWPYLPYKSPELLEACGFEEMREDDAPHSAAYIKIVQVPLEKLSRIASSSNSLHTAPRGQAMIEYAEEFKIIPECVLQMLRYFGLPLLDPLIRYLTLTHAGRFASGWNTRKDLEANELTSNSERLWIKCLRNGGESRWYTYEGADHLSGTAKERVLNTGERQARLLIHSIGNTNIVLTGVRRFQSQSAQAILPPSVKNVSLHAPIVTLLSMIAIPFLGLGCYNQGRPEDCTDGLYVVDSYEQALEEQLTVSNIRTPEMTLLLYNSIKERKVVGKPYTITLSTSILRMQEVFSLPSTLINVLHLTTLLALVPFVSKATTILPELDLAEESARASVVVMEVDSKLFVVGSSFIKMCHRRYNDGPAYQAALHASVQRTILVADALAIKYGCKAPRPQDLAYFMESFANTKEARLLDTIIDQYQTDSNESQTRLADVHSALKGSNLQAGSLTVRHLRFIGLPPDCEDFHHGVLLC